MSHHAYHTAIGMLNRGLFVTCTPGTLNGEPCVRTVGHKLDDTALKYLTSPNPRVRVGYLYGALSVSREHAKRRGLELNG